MDMEFLKRLYMACSDENPIFEAGQNLCELWRRIDDTKVADRDFRKALAAAELPFLTADGIAEATCAANIAYELQGFANGFSLAMRIATGKVV